MDFYPEGLAFFIFGALVGSFLNVIIYRWPREESFVFPRSKCDHCSKPIPFYLNIPIFAWVVLKGKTACCGKRLSFRHPCIEFLTGALFYFTFTKFGWSVQTAEYMIFISMALPCFFIDLDHFLLPDIFTFPGMALGLLGSFFSPTRTPMESILGLIMGGGSFWLISFFYEKYRKIEGMGFGDVKLIAWLGALGGLSSLFFIIMVSSFLGLAVGIFLILFKGGGRHTAIPFGPFLILAGFIYYYFSADLPLQFF